jgi:Zn-dependent protease with chaperone function
MALLNTVLIDPMVWHGIDDDPEVAKIKDVIQKYILPGVAESNKALHATIKKILSPDAQFFIFRHELGHVWYNYSYKRILLVGLIGFISAGAALMAARATMLAWNGTAALLVGIVVGAAADLFLSYSSNIFFKAREEKKADLFAAHFSSKKEIEAAADFFEQYEHHAQEYRKSIGGLIARMPTIILSGHIDGVTRGRYLRDVARSK